MSESVYAGLTSQTIDVFLGDSSSTTGGGLTGLTHSSSGLTAYYRKGATGTSTAITLATQTVGGAWSSGGFVQIDATNMPGVYRFDIPNAVVDTEGFATVYFRGAANLVPTAIRIDCRPYPVDVKKFGGANGTFSGGRPEVVTATNNDKTGYALSSVGNQAILNLGTSAQTEAGSVGKLIADNLNATISSRSNHTAADVWTVSTRTLSSFGSLVSDIWSAATRTLTAFGFAVTPSNASDTTAIRAVTDKLDTAMEPDGLVHRFTANALEESPGGGTIQNNIVVPRAIATSVTKPDQIAIIRGDLVTFSLDELGDLSTRTKLWFTAKRKHADADTDAVIQIEEAGGLLRLLGVAPSSSSLASIVVTDEDAGEIVITLKGEATKLLSPADAGVWDVQWLPSGGNGPKTPRSGTHTITSDVTRATS